MNKPKFKAGDRVLIAGSEHVAEVLRQQPDEGEPVYSLRYSRKDGTVVERSLVEGELSRAPKA
jgi:hypothetical protein